MKLRTLIQTALFAAFAAIPTAGCGDDGHDDHHMVEFSCADETRADAYVAGLEKSSSQINVQLVSDPAPPAKGDNTWTLTITDLEGTPIDGLSLDSDPFMPDHGHGTPLQEEVTAGANAGEYVLAPINLWMPGYWEVEISASGDGIDDSVMYKICIDG
jgi:hypothetical protein